MPKHAMKDVIVLLPGIMGSVLERDGTEVWAPSAGVVWRALRSLGGTLQSLELEGDDPDVDDLDDGFTATRLLPDIHLIPGFWTIDGYGAISATIKARFDVTEGENYFEFPYDWRRYLQSTARRLDRESERWLADWKERSGNDDAKLVLVCHSMGGLVARQFLEQLDGWRRTRRLVTFGTPYRGSINAVEGLVNGIGRQIGPLKFDLTEVLRSMPSVHQLLPVYRCVDDGSGELVRVAEANLPGIAPDKAAEALAFHDGIRDAVREHADDPAYVLDGYSLHPIIGQKQTTKQSVVVEGGEVSFATDWRGADHGGDGTVPRVSAVPREIADASFGTFSAEQHASLQNDAALLAHLEGVLSGTEIDLTKFESRTGPPPELGLELDDVHAADESVPVRVRADADDLELTVTVSDTAGVAGTVRAPLVQRADGRYEALLDPLPPALYRVAVGVGRAESVTGILSVFDADDPGEALSDD
ncbi:MAG: hypothetical protein AAFZ07_19765 [Actinomycetota bacterium]